MPNKKIKVFILGRDGVNWSIDHDRENILCLFKKSNDFVVTKNIFFADIVYLVWYDMLSKKILIFFLNILKVFKKVKVFAVVTNQIQNTPEKIQKYKKIIDIWISPNTKTYDLLKEKKQNTIKIPFLINDKIFRNLNSKKKELCEKLEIPFFNIENRFLIGSFQRDSLGSDLSKPKWQKDPDLLIDLLINMPKNKILLILAGPRRHYTINKCKKNNIPYLFIGDEKYINKNKDDINVNNLSLETINILYNLIDLYIVTSKSEGGPKAILESSLTQTLILSTNVGLAPDIINKKLIYNKDNKNKVTEIISTFLNKKERGTSLIEFNFKSAKDKLNKKRILSSIKKGYENLHII
jgi:hypothetical protein